MQNNILMMHILDVHTASPFKDLFKINPMVLKSITGSMAEAGFDMVHPLVLWAGHQSILIDGHTRLQAAKDAGLLNVPVVTKEFETEVEALEYAIASQRNRRNLTEAEMLACLQELDKRKTAGRPKKLAPDGANFGKSAEATAKLLGVSRTKVERMRTVNEHGSNAVKSAIRDGHMSINAAYNKILADRKKEKSKDLSAEELGLKRTDALKAELISSAKKILEKEIQLYPEVEYSEEAKDALARTLAQEIRQLIYGILPYETTN